MMKTLHLFFYNFAINAYFLFIKIAAIFGHNKAKKFIEGRRNLFEKLNKKLESASDERIWFHISSLGEYEQAKPVIEALRKKYPLHSFVLSFFSPSGFEVVSNTNKTDILFYLPKDTQSNSIRLCNAINPQMLFFVKYDLWYHIINTAKRKQIPLFLFSALFRKNHIAFRQGGLLYRKMLQNFTQIFVQNKLSKSLLKHIGINSIIAGDTRVDSVISVSKETFNLDKIYSFKAEKKLLIIGSAWEKEIEIIATILPELIDTYKIIIAPHDISDNFVQNIEKAFPQYITTRYQNGTDDNAIIMIIDTIGSLKYLYRAADVAIVGGGFKKSGIHSILEPAAYGIPIFFGPNYKKFVEATLLIQCGGAKPISNIGELRTLLLQDSELQKMKLASLNYVAAQKGATEIIMSYL